MRIAITGATGMVGRSILRMLSQREEEIQLKLLSRRKEPDVGKLGENITQVEWTQGDITNEDLMEKFTDTDVLIHAAAAIPGTGGWEQFHETNVNGTQTVIQAAVNNEVQSIIYISTTGIYEYTTKMITEDSKKRSSEKSYGFSKAVAESKLWDIVKEFQGKVIALRPPVIFGEFHGQELKQALDQYFNGKVPFIGGGNAKMAWTTGNDVAHAVSLAMNRKTTEHQAYNVVSFLLSMKEIWELIKIDEPDLPKPKKIPYFIAMTGAIVLAILPGKASETVTPKRVRRFAKGLRVSSEKIRDTLGFQSQQTPEEAMRETIAYYRSQK